MCHVCDMLISSFKDIRYKDKRVKAMRFKAIRFKDMRFKDTTSALTNIRMTDHCSISTIFPTTVMTFAIYNVNTD